MTNDDHHDDGRELGQIRQALSDMQQQFDHRMAEQNRLVASADEATRLAITAWVFRHLVDHARAPCRSYRGLIYGRLGFDHRAYFILLEAGGLLISNEFDLVPTSDDWHPPEQP